MIALGGLLGGIKSVGGLFGGLFSKHHPHTDPEYDARSQQLLAAARDGNVRAARMLYWGRLRDNQTYGWSFYLRDWNSIASTPVGQEAQRQGELVDDFGPISHENTLPKPPAPAPSIPQPTVFVKPQVAITPAPTATPVQIATTPAPTTPQPSVLDQLLGPIKDAIKQGISGVREATAEQIQNATAVGGAELAQKVAPAESPTAHAVSIPTDSRTLIFAGVVAVLLVILLLERRR